MRKVLCIILVVMLSISLSGCWGRREPKTLALVSSVIYDLSDNDNYKVTVEVVNPSTGGGTDKSGSEKSTNIMAISEGNSLPEVIRNVSESLDRTIFGGHNKVRFFTERFAKKDITSIMDYILRDHLTDENPLMVVIKSDDPQQIYSCATGLSETVGDYIDHLSEIQPNITSKAVFVKTLDFIKDYYNEGKQPVAGVVEFVKCESKFSDNNNKSKDLKSSQTSSDEKYKITYKGLAAFKDKKLVGYMDDIDARAYNFITNNIKSAVISIVSENSETVVLANNVKAQIKTEIKDDKVTVDIKIKNRMSIIQENGNNDISKMEPLAAVEDAFDKQMAEEIAAAIQKAQNEFQSDIFGFGVSMHKQHPEEWKEIKENWDDYFTRATINVSVESTVDRSGEIKQPFRMETE